jgi:ABC-2 type transport system ATP-binding protein
MSVIETDGLTKRYGDTLAVDRISFEVEEGQVFGFLGPNGSGKTTTIGMLLGILTPTGGDFRLFGVGPGGPLEEIRRRVGATLEQPNFYPYLSGRDNLRMAAHVKGVGEEGLERALEVVGLSARAGDKYKGYSLGMKQRLALAATMLGDPDLIVLDEPANGLDPEGMREIRRIVQRLGEGGTTVFLSSHLLWEVERTCTHVAILREGKIVRRGTVEEVTGGAARAAMRAADADALEVALDAYPPARSIRRREDGSVVARLEDDDLAALNRFLAGKGVWLERLAPERRSLEDAFLEITGDGAGGAGEPGEAAGESGEPAAGRGMREVR